MARILITTDPELKKLKKGNYSCRYRIPKHGKEPEKKSPWKQLAATTKNKAKREAEIYREELEDELNNYAMRDDITFGEYARRWHEDREGTDEINELSWDREEIIIKSIETSCIANIELKDLTTEDIDALKAEGGKKGYSKDKQRRILEKAKQILKHAVSRRKIKYNPADAVKGIKRKKKKRRSVPANKLQKFLNEVEADEQIGKTVVVRIAIGTGMRRGEILGLNWGDINFKEKKLTIKRQYNSKGKIAEPKDESFGVIPLDQDTLNYLKKWKEASKKYRNGRAAKKEDPVCCGRQGQRLSASNFDKWRRRYFVEHGLGTFEKVEEWYDKRGIKRYKFIGYEGYNLHELRHTAATDLLGLGTDLRSVQAIMRHKHISTTEGYIHEIPENLKDAINALGKKRATPTKTKKKN